jgi:hypothetical protein
VTPREQAEQRLAKAFAETYIHAPLAIPDDKEHWSQQCARIAADFAERLAMEALNNDAWERGWPRLNDAHQEIMRKALPWDAVLPVKEAVK